MSSYLDKFTNILEKTELSEESKKNYKFRLTRLTKLTQRDVDWIIDHCKETFEIMKKNNIVEPQSVKAYINSILTLFKYTPKLKEKKPKAHKCWLGFFQKVKAIADHKYETLTASQRQIKAYVPWSEITKKRDELDKNTQIYLLLCLYTMIPPCRADLNAIKIYYNAEGKDNENYMVVYEDKIKLVYNEFKSKSRKLQKYQKILPPNLEAVVRNSLERRPREYLIVSPRTRQPYFNVTSYIAYFDRKLREIFGKNVSINTLRHSFVNSIDFNKMTPIEKTAIAQDLMHSTDTMDRYRLVVPGHQSETGKNRVCEVVCKDI